MKCPECRNAIHAFLDGDTTTAELRAHLDICPSCRREFAGARLLRDGVARLPRPTVPTTLAPRLIAAFEEERRLHRRRWVQNVAWISGVAASLLGLLLFGHWMMQPDAPLEPIVARKDKPMSATAEAADFHRGADEAQKAVASLAHSVKEKTKGHWEILLSAANPLESMGLRWHVQDFGPPEAPTLLELEEPLEPAAQSLRSAGRSVAQSLQPMANSARSAVAFLARELPVLDFQSKEN